MTTSMFDPMTPSKKPLTDNVKNAIDASNMHRDALVPEDLSMALQHIGRKVRKSVTEGYNTQYFGTFTVPATPRSSPAKSVTTASTPTPVFRTANDAFNCVFPPVNTRVPLTPSPKKRTRADVDETRRGPDGDVDMDIDGAESDDDPVIVILGPDADTSAFGQPRKIKPLRRGMARPQCTPIDPFMVPSEPEDKNVLFHLWDAVGMNLSEGGTEAST